MPDDYEQLQRKIEEGLWAVRELRRLKADEQRRDRPRLRLIKGGAIAAAVGAGLEWLWGYKVAVVVAAAAATFAGGMITDHPASPGADPPIQEPIVSKPPTTKPPDRPEPRASRTYTVKPTPRRASPPQTTKPPTQPQVAPSQEPAEPSPTPSVRLPVTPSLSSLTPTPTPKAETAAASCQGISLAGLCLLNE